MKPDLLHALLLGMCSNLSIVTQAKLEDEWNAGTISRQGDRRQRVIDREMTATAAPSINDTVFDSSVSSNEYLGYAKTSHGYMQSMITGIACTVLLFVAFMPFASTWDKYITKRLSGRTIYIAQHFDQDQSSHLSEIILRNSSSQLSENVVTSRSRESDESSEVGLTYHFRQQLLVFNKYSY